MRLLEGASQTPHSHNYGHYLALNMCHCTGGMLLKGVLHVYLLVIAVSFRLAPIDDKF